MSTEIIIEAGYLKVMVTSKCYKNRAKRPVSTKSYKYQKTAMKLPFH